MYYLTFVDLREGGVVVGNELAVRASRPHAFFGRGRFLHGVVGLRSGEYSPAVGAIEETPC